VQRQVLVAFHHPPVLLHSPFIDAIRSTANEIATLSTGCWRTADSSDPTGSF
jgi:hypothetical protein